MPCLVSHDGLSLHFEDTGGTGVPILCLAGLTRNGADFDTVLPHVPDRRLIRPDYRGRGQSDWADPATYTIAAEARDATDLMDHLGITRAAILGTSRGGLIAMHLAATAHDRLAGVCLNDIGPVIDPSGLAAIGGYIGRNPPQRTLDEAAAARAAHSPGFEAVSQDRWRAIVARQFVEEPGGLRIRYDPALARAMGGAAPGNAWTLFDALAGLPLALIRGANSDLLSTATATEMQRRRPDMLFADVPGRGHVPFLDEPESLAVLTQWIGML